MTGKLDAPMGAQERFDRQVAISLATLGLACGLAGLSGWIFDIPVLREFGAAHAPIWPWTAIGFIAIALSFIMSLMRRTRCMFVLCAVPILIAAIALAERWLNLDTGFDRLLFARKVAGYAALHPGRPGANATTVMLLLALSELSAYLPVRPSQEVRGLIAAAPLPLIVTASVLTLHSTPGDGRDHLFTNSLAGEITALAIALAMIVRHTGLSWVRALIAHPVIHNLRIILLCFLASLVLIPLGLHAIINEEVSQAPVAAQALIVVSQALALICVSHWAVTLVMRQYSTQTALTKALDVANMVLTTPDGRIAHWSNGASQLYGWSAEEAKGQMKYALLRSRCESADSSLPRNSGAGLQELVEIDRNGREIAVLERTYPIDLPDGRRFVVHKMTDISDRVSAIAQLRVSEERLGIAMAANRFGVFDWDGDADRIVWSPGARAQLPCLPTESISTQASWAALMDPEDLPSMLDRGKRMIARRQELVNFRYRLRNAHGMTRIVEGASRNFFHADGRLARSIGAIADVTEREEREAALRRREAQLRSIVETAPDAILVVDAQGLVRIFSAAAEELWGYSERQVVGRSISMLAPEQHARFHAALFRRFQKGARPEKASESFSAMGQAADGRRFPLEVRVGVMRLDEEALLTLFARDVSERLATEGRLAELNAELAHASRQIAVSELATDMAHELNQPLSAAVNYLSAADLLIGNGGDPAHLADLLRSASAQTLRAGEIIRRLRRFSARGEVEMRREPLAATVRDAAAMVLAGSNQFDIRFTYDLDPDAPTIFADRIQVQQVLVNLLRNALDVMEKSRQPERRIHIRSTRLDSRTVEIEVADNGPGISPEIEGQLFSRFTTTKAPDHGLGIGLSISKRIVEAHGGMMSAENRPEGGAAFRFTLATEQAEQAA